MTVLMFFTFVAMLLSNFFIIIYYENKSVEDEFSQFYLMWEGWTIVAIIT
jgi:hypothetical protein